MCAATVTSATTHCVHRCCIHDHAILRRRAAIDRQLCMAGCMPMCCINQLALTCDYTFAIAAICPVRSLAPSSAASSAVDHSPSIPFRRCCSFGFDASSTTAYRCSSYAALLHHSHRLLLAVCRPCCTSTAALLLSFLRLFSLSLSAMVNSLNKVKIVKKRRKTFQRHYSDRLKRLDKGSWRCPKGIDSEVRRRYKGAELMPNVGYGSNAKTRHMRPNGLYTFRINNLKVSSANEQTRRRMRLELANWKDVLPQN